MEELEEIPQRKSRTRKKKESNQLQQAGEKLLLLSKAQLDKLDIPDSLKNAVTEAALMSREARRRQIQYIGSLMRKIDSESLIEAIEACLAGQASQDILFQQVEVWRDQLVDGNDEPVEIILDRFPQIDRQQFRQLIRNARKEKAAEKTPKFSKQLFRFLRDLTQEAE